jgi:thiol-disulfide isomerase/thioredoxin
MRRAIRVALVIVAALVATGAVLYARNTTPAVPPISTADAAAAGPPWVVKMHAQWCPVCMLTKGMWSQIEQEYAGRVRLAVFDFTDESTTAAARAEAHRLGLGEFLEEAGYATGTVVVLDGRSKEIVAWINGSRDFSEYRAAIDSAIAATALQ